MYNKYQEKEVVCLYIGIDIGGTKCAVVLANENGEILKKLRFDTSTYEKTMDEILRAVEALGPAKAIGISCGGPLDSAKGVILSPPNLPEWDAVPITRMLEERFHTQAYLQNDANACALAEWKFGAGKGFSHMVFLTFGTGMGAGLILGGKLYEGANGNAGEIGHIRMEADGPIGYGKRGSFEGFCSGGGIKQLGQMKARALFSEGKAPSFCASPAEIETITARSIALCAEQGHEDAREIYRLCGEYLGRGLAVLIDILNPEAIVLGSIYERSGHLLYESMMKALQRESLPMSLGVCKILPAALGDSIGDRAAIAVAMTGKEENKK